jgi:hypothetical protein
MTAKCECGKPADGEYLIWNGMHHLEVCSDCWYDPENIAVEACVSFAEGGFDTLEEALRIELGFRELEWTVNLERLVDARYCEWYFEGEFRTTPGETG